MKPNSVKHYLYYLDFSVSFPYRHSHSQRFGLCTLRPSSCDNCLDISVLVKLHWAKSPISQSMKKL